MDAFDLERGKPLDNMLTKFSQTDREGTEMIPLPPQTKCIHCGGAVTIAREVSVARHAWDHLKPLESNADTINVERHLPTKFQLSSPRLETGMPFHTGYGNLLSGESSRMLHTRPLPTNPCSLAQCPLNTQILPLNPLFLRRHLILQNFVKSLQLKFLHLKILRPVMG
jgi:hypothetical protein